MPSVSLHDIVVTFPSARRRQRRTLKAWAKDAARSLLSFQREPEERVSALRGVSLELRAGEVAGVVGENGAGKTTLLRVVSGLLEPDSGRVRVEGTISTVFNLGAGFLPDLTGRENIHLVGAVHGINSRRLQRIEDRIIRFSGLGDAVDRPLKTFSAGMKSRLGFSIIAYLDTDIVILDEVLSAGDVRFRKKAGNLIERFSHEEKILIVVSHSAAAIREYCTTAFHLHQGKIAARGDPEEVCDAYLSRGARKRGTRTRRQTEV